VSARSGVRVRCPNPGCGAELEVPPDRLGKNEPCPSCGQVITVVPIALRERAVAERLVPATDVHRRCMPVALVLENVRSLWNVGSMFRTADGAGVAQMWLCGYTGRPPREEISKTALGADAVVPWFEAATALDAVRILRERGHAIVALERTATSTPLSEARVGFPCALAVGNEVAGLSEELLDAADAVHHLPMHGLKSSLNVAVAAGIALYELRAKAEASRAAVGEPAEGRGVSPDGP
jgi:23S rRNA (guanosine2251-2'-O)-methyltransferase